MAEEQLNIALDLIAELSLEDQNRLVLIGGQAISFWAYYLFGENEISEKESNILTSSDLDIVADNNESIRILARAWNGQSKFPSIGDHTPNRALIQVRRPQMADGESYTIDVMGDVHGARSSQLVKSSVEIEWSQRGRTLRFRVVSPEMLLWTRIANVRLGHMGQAKIRRDVERAMFLCRAVKQDLTSHALEMRDTLAPDEKKVIEREVYNRCAFIYRDISKKNITRYVLADFPELCECFYRTIPKLSFLRQELYDYALPGWFCWLDGKVKTIQRHRENRKQQQPLKVI
ncbi:hypothetical protein [Chromohalobacter nigrandesensis]|uniref:hypothetical protein n=1 Tax=Chromohalobacter nigrandesensis TaxID=119863 RepID=UPI001FF45FE5|nr:hypothetical protein [Chromohalobacter nigrandesensis]MCK0744126.1 hypothetical protein [Chromohalobacter nigrandesensis]